MRAEDVCLLMNMGKSERWTHVRPEHELMLFKYQDRSQFNL